MSRKSGYEYRYRVSVADNLKEYEGKRSSLWRTYIKVQTNFILKPIGAEEILMDTERFPDRMTLHDEHIPSNLNKLDSHIRARLSQYCMPDADIRALAQMASDTVHDPRYDSYRTIHVQMFVDVYTVQLEGEPLDATMKRSVEPDFLIPLQFRWSWKYLKELLVVVTVRKKEKDLHRYLRGLPLVRVREEAAADDMDSCPICLNVRFIPDKHAFHEKHSVARKDGLGLMEVCPICWREPVGGAKIATLPCKHAFHDHCIFSWLLKSQCCPLKSQCCPLCRAKIKFKLDC